MKVEVEVALFMFGFVCERVGRAACYLCCRSGTWEVGLGVLLVW
jgi:hypothetical protein